VLDRIRYERTVYFVDETAALRSFPARRPAAPLHWDFDAALGALSWRERTAATKAMLALMRLAGKAARLWPMFFAIGFGDHRAGAD